MVRQLQLQSVTINYTYFPWGWGGWTMYIIMCSYTIITIIFGCSLYILLLSIILSSFYNTQKWLHQNYYWPNALVLPEGFSLHAIAGLKANAFQYEVNNICHKIYLHIFSPPPNSNGSSSTYSHYNIWIINAMNPGNL